MGAGQSVHLYFYFCPYYRKQGKNNSLLIRIIIKRTGKNTRFLFFGLCEIDTVMSNASETGEMDVFSQSLFCKWSNKEYVPISFVSRFCGISNMLSVTRGNHFNSSNSL